MAITYGTPPNSSLALDFGFTLPENPHDEVQIWMEVSSEDPLRAEKLLHEHGFETDAFGDGSDSSGAWFGLRSEFPWSATYIFFLRKIECNLYFLSAILECYGKVR